MNVIDYGASENGSSDSTIAIQRAFDAAANQTRLNQPAGGSYQGSCPAVVFPSGKYIVSGTIRVGPYQQIVGEKSLIVQSNPNLRLFTFDNCYRVGLDGMQFLGGSRQLQFSNQNIDATMLTIRDCTFQGWSDTAIFAEGTTGDLHMSASLFVDRCNFDGGTAIYTQCDTTQISNCEAHFRGPTVKEGSAWCINKTVGGVLGLTNNTLTPELAVVNGLNTNVTWIDNWGSVVCERVRFGGEQAGAPIITHHGDPNLKNPWMGRLISLSNSQLSCGQDANPKSAIITLLGVPQCIRITGCSGLVSGSIPVIRVAPGYSLDAAVKSISQQAKTSLPMYSIRIEGNQFFTSQPIPQPLQQFVGK